MSSWSQRHIDRHENGHRRVAEAFGCRTRITGSGDHTQMEILSGPPLTPTQYAAILYGSGHGGHERDHAIAERHLRRLPKDQRIAARKEARRLAPKHGGNR